MKRSVSIFICVICAILSCTWDKPERNPLIGRMYEKEVATCYCDLDYHNDSVAHYYDDSTIVMHTLEFYNNDSLIYYRFYRVNYYNFEWQYRFDRDVNIESYNYQYYPDDDLLWIVQLDSILKIRVVYNKIIFFEDNPGLTDIYYYTLRKPTLK